ncbi:MAG: hypothetical protein AAF702_17060 [Chloroflexota bacterium]
MDKIEDVDPPIKVVGISASGKSTVVRTLRELGYNAVPVSQEHSEIPYLWELYGMPRYLIYLSISLSEQRRRRPDVTWSKRVYRAETLRLLHARDHANLRIDTSFLAAHSVLSIVQLSLARANISPGNQPLPPHTPTGMNRDFVKSG